jgi:hypothetical protein
VLDQLRDQIATYLADHHICVISALGACAMPARYRSDGLKVDCLVPRWSEVAYALEQDARAALVIADAPSDGARWLEVRGSASIVASPEWKGWRLDSTRHGVPLADLYLVVRVTPQRMDLVDETRGWGARETVEM